MASFNLSNFFSESYFNVIWKRFDKKYPLTVLFYVLAISAFVVSCLFYYSTYELFDNFNVITDNLDKIINMATDELCSTRQTCENADLFLQSVQNEFTGDEAQQEGISFQPIDTTFGVARLLQSLNVDFSMLVDLFNGVFILQIIMGASVVIYACFYDFFMRYRLGIFWQSLFIISPAIFNTIALSGSYMFLAFWQGGLQTTLGALATVNGGVAISGFVQGIDIGIDGVARFLARPKITEMINESLQKMNDPDTLLDLPIFDTVVGAIACACIINALALAFVLSSVAYSASVTTISKEIGQTKEVVKVDETPKKTTGSMYF